MLKKKTLASMTIALSAIGFNSAQAQEMNSVTQLACEAVLCLSTPDRPAECAASISHYFGIVMSKPWKTLQARKNFLKLCPDVSEADANKTAAATTQNAATGENAAASNATETGDDRTAESKENTRRLETSSIR
jgi:hypothetical protein